jgi:hypothetical protein
MRQRRELRHHRRLQDLAELRSVLDEAAVALEVAIHHLQWAWVAFGSDYVRREEDEDVKRRLVEMRDATYRMDMKACADARDTMMRTGRRLAIRLGPGEPLYLTYADAIGLVIEGIRDIGKARAVEDAGEVVSEDGFKELSNRLGAVRRLFVTQAVARVGSDLDQ